ncbi:MAG: biotin/lipoyl-binding protein [Chloroflexi bacterium]|nr:biotin/lipoyl-binding protein [Chloroflexota bacterium]
MSVADQLGELLKLVDQSDIEELVVEHNGTRFVIRRTVGQDGSVVRASAEPNEAEHQPEAFVITSPVVGVFRRATGSARVAPLDEGDTVVVGQVVGAVEAMRMLNRVQSERAGVVQEVLVREGQPVEYGQPLFVLREL